MVQDKRFAKEGEILLGGSSSVSSDAVRYVVSSVRYGTVRFDTVSTVR